VDPHPLAVLLDPVAQPRPLAQEGLVGDLDRAGADREQALVGEPIDDAGGGFVAVLSAASRRNTPRATPRCASSRRS
jgi:hypothetical protein